MTRRVLGFATAADHRQTTVGHDETPERERTRLMAEAELETLARRRADAGRNLTEAICQLRAAVLRELAAGQPEAAVARDAGVDRMTVRRWAGK
jgi:uncharacterized MAPEG superfamily protein